MSDAERVPDDYDQYGHPTPHRQPETQLSVDPATGRLALGAPPAVGATPDPDAVPFFVAIAATRDRYPLDEADIVLDAGWTRDPETGHVVPDGWDGTQAMRERALGSDA